MNFPRRIRLDQFTPAELAIYNATQEVEKAGCDTKLTEAIILLSQARELVSDYVDGELMIGLRLPTLNSYITTPLIEFTKDNFIKDFNLFIEQSKVFAKGPIPNVEIQIYENRFVTYQNVVGFNINFLPGDEIYNLNIITQLGESELWHVDAITINPEYPNVNCYYR